MNFIHEYKKCLACVILVIFLVVLQIITGQDTTVFVRDTLRGLTGLLLGGAFKFSILSTSEREVLQNNLPAKDPDDFMKDYDDPVKPEDFTDPMKSHPLDQ